MSKEKVSLQLDYYYHTFNKETVDEEVLNFWKPLPMYVLSSKCPMMAYLRKNEFQPDIEKRFRERNVLIRTLKNGKYKSLTESEIEFIIESYNLNMSVESFSKLYEYIDQVINNNGDKDNPATLVVDKTNYFQDNGETLMTYNNVFYILGKETYLYHVMFINEGYDATTVLEQIKEKLFVLANMYMAQSNANSVVKVAPIFITESDVLVPAYWTLSEEYLMEKDINPADIIKKYMVSILKNYSTTNVLADYQKLAKSYRNNKLCKHCIYKSLERC